jgi:hypothetical protein
MTYRKSIEVTMIGTALSALPFAPGWVTIHGVDVPALRGATACAQATSCAPLDDYVCSTFHQDWEDKVCYTGCAPPPGG